MDQNIGIIHRKLYRQEKDTKMKIQIFRKRLIRRQQKPGNYIDS